MQNLVLSTLFCWLHLYILGFISTLAPFGCPHSSCLPVVLSHHVRLQRISITRWPILVRDIIELLHLHLTGIRTCINKSLHTYYMYKQIATYVLHVYTKFTIPIWAECSGILSVLASTLQGHEWRYRPMMSK